MPGLACCSSVTPRPGEKGLSPVGIPFRKAVLAPSQPPNVQLKITAGTEVFATVAGLLYTADWSTSQDAIQQSAAAAVQWPSATPAPTGAHLTINWLTDVPPSVVQVHGYAEVDAVSGTPVGQASVSFECTSTTTPACPPPGEDGTIALPLEPAFSIVPYLAVFGIWSLPPAQRRVQGSAYASASWLFHLAMAK